MTALYQRVLVPCDGSEPSLRALDAAVDLVRLTGGTVEALGVEGPLPRYAATIGEVDEMLIEREKYFSGILDDARTRAQRRGVDITTTLRPGHAAEVIVHYARDTDVDLIVVGHKGHFRHDFGLGSTAARVARHAPCAVLVIR
jgi:nucleotide-binding universal stress UspA family protein